MGNLNSKTADDEHKNFYDVIDFISSYYILTMDFKSLTKLSEKEYCDKLVVLTSDIIERYFNDSDITYLSQRVKNGAEINEMKTENVRYINKDNLDSLDISNDKNKSIKKKRVCIGIAKFYVKIAHIFSAIVMTVNPVYTYKDANGQPAKAGLLQKDTIPKNVERNLQKLNICDNRIRALKKGEIINDQSGNISIQPNVCDMNLNNNKQTKSLADEPGMAELLTLYLDDKYDYSTGQFTGMSDATSSQFAQDLQLFYTSFTGNKTMPAEIKTFSDIKLRDYNKHPGCQGNNPTFKMQYTLKKKDPLLVEYAENIQKMIQSAADNQSKLLAVINLLFTYVIDPFSSKKVIRVNPKLTDAILQTAIEKTRQLIVNLYVKCEEDYVNGVKIYEAIVESKILETTQKQIANLKKEASNLVNETKKLADPIVAPVAPIVAPVAPIAPSAPTENVEPNI